MWSYLPIIREAAQIWAVVGIGTLVGVGCLAGAYFLPALRQLFLGLALAAFVSTFFFEYGVKQEHDVAVARQVRAEALRVQRDEIQGRLAKEDEARRNAGLAELNKREDESEAAYEKRLSNRKVAACPLTDDDLN